MKRWLYGLLTFAVIFLMVPAARANAQEGSGTFELTVESEPGIASEFKSSQPDENANLLTVSPVGYTFGDYTYVFFDYQGSAPIGHIYDSQNHTYINEYGLSGMDAGYTGWMLALPKWSGSQELCFSAMDHDGPPTDDRVPYKVVARKTVSVTATEYTGNVCDPMILSTKDTSSWAELNVYGQHNTISDAYLYDGDTRVGLFDINGSYEKHSISFPVPGIHAKLVMGAYEDSLSSTCFSGTLYITAPLTSGKSYEVRATVDGTACVIGSITADDSIRVNSVYSGTHYVASDKPTMVVDYSGGKASDFRVEIRDFSGKTVATSAGGKSKAQYKGSEIFELEGSISKETLRGYPVVVVNNAGACLARANYNLSPGIVAAYYNHVANEVVATTNGIPDGTAIHATAMTADTGGYSATGTVTSNVVILKFQKDGADAAFPVGGVQISYTYEFTDVLTNVPYEGSGTGNVTVYGNSSSTYISGYFEVPAIFYAGEANEFVYYIAKSGADTASGDFSATFTVMSGADSGRVIAEKMALTPVDAAYEGYYALKGTLPAVAEMCEIRMTLYRGNTELRSSWIYLLERGKLYGSLYTGRNSDGTLFAQVYCPMGPQLDVSKFVLSVTDVYGDAVNLTATLDPAESGDTWFTYNLTNIPAGTNILKISVTYDGQPIYSTYNIPLRALSTILYLEEGDGYVAWYTQDGVRGYVGVETPKPAVLKVYQTGTFNVLKTINLSVANIMHSFTTADLAGLSAGNYQTAYDLVVYDSQTGECLGVSNCSFVAIGSNGGEVSAEETRAMVEAFVRRMYTCILNREAEPEGLNAWTEQIMNGMTAATCAEYFIIIEPEFASYNVNNAEFLRRMYATFFDRPGDPAGIANWTNWLEKGASRKFVAAHFVDSTEFTGICAAYNIPRGDIALSEEDTQLRDENLFADREKVAEYVERLYNQILGRPSEEAGKTNWVNVICNHGITAFDAATIGFFQSEEYVNKNKNVTEFLTDCYHALMGREPDEVGLAGWVEHMNNGMSREEVVLHFGESKEFTEILQSYGLKCKTDEQS